METIQPSPKSKTLTLISSSQFLSSFNSHLLLSPQTPIPHSFSLLSNNSPLPSIPSDLPKTKLIPNTKFIVDGFKHSGDFSVSYFLSHFHSDHYTGLNSNWCKGMIYCSELTARLLVNIMKVSPLFVAPLEMNSTVEIDGCEVTIVDANHCPGAVQFLVKVSVGDGRRSERYVHTGDFRFSESMKKDCALNEFVGSDAVFLDTTYCNPRYVFPSQDESIEHVVSIIQNIRDQNDGLGNVLILIATYVIGKERILLEVSKRLGCLLYVDGRKMDVLSCLGFEESGIFTQDDKASSIHVIGWNVLGDTWPYFRPNFVKMKEIMLERGYSKAVGFVSTGWMYETKNKGFAVRSKDELDIHLVPYSEHSSYEELRDYVRFLRPKRVIPTVGADVEKIDSKGALALCKHFQGLVDENANKQEFLLAFNRNVYTVNVDKADKVEESNVNNDSEELNGIAIEDAKSELRESLPKWVTEGQILELIRSFKGDTVEAVTEFFERETEFYEKANVINLPAIDSDAHTSTQILFPAINTPQESKKPAINLFDISTKSKSQNLATVKSGLPNKRVLPSKTSLPKKRASTSSIQSKINKKRKTSSTSMASGSKQSMITNFFGKVTSASHEDDMAVNQEKNMSVDFEKELDQFMQIIEDGITRNAAASLLEKVQGNVNEAVEKYYNILTEVFGDEDTLSISTQDTNNSSQEQNNMSSLFIHATSSEVISMMNVSLPIEKYSPIDHACWKAGEACPYLHLARTFELVEREKGKTKTTAILCNMFRSLLALSPDDVLPSVYLCTNKLSAAHENMELNIGGSLVITALEEACGIKRSRIKEMYNTTGDLGDVAQECRQTQTLLAPPRPLSVKNLFHTLRKISVEAGSGSAMRKKNLVVSLLRSCREMEIKFVVRTLVRNLRIGAMMRTILPALGQAVVMNEFSLVHNGGYPESLKSRLQDISAEVTEAYNVLPNLDLLVPSLMSKGISFSASSLEMAPGTPIPPMLAKITNGTLTVLKLFQNRAFTCEYKYDGQRAQIHKLADGSMRVFSRNMKDSTTRFPDLIHIVKELSSPAFTTFILDAEVVAVDRKKGNKLMSLQELSSRERGSKDLSVSVGTIKIDICVFVFDIMFMNGQRLLDLPFRQRRTYLKDLFPDEKPGFLELANQVTVDADKAHLSNENTLSQINSFFEDAYKSSCEGIMVKSLDVDAVYCASKRSDSWLKIKRDYVEGLGDSFDLVPIGAWYGNGRKAGWYSPFLMACYNPVAQEYESVCRVMSGFSDSFYVEMKEFFSGDKILSRKLAYYQTDETPDLWFSPELVWEIKGSDLSISPVHHAAIGLIHQSKGISIRNPRFVRVVSDRNPEDCSTSSDIASIFNSQTRKMDVTN